jgi:CHAD domain-containing protein
MRTSPTPRSSPRSPSAPAAANDGRTPLAQSLGHRVEALGDHLPSALDGEERGIHQARVATRRLREIVPVVVETRKGLGAKLRRRLKRLTRALGPVRELDVACTLITDRAAGKPEPGVIALRAHLTEQRLAAFERLHEACDAGRAKWLLEHLADVVRELERVARGGRGELAGRERRRLARRVIDRARALGDAVSAAGAILIVDRVHAVRIAAKRLRYALELTGELQLARTAALVSKLRSVQDVLGEMHDLDVLRHHAARVRRDLPPDSIVAKDLERISTALEADIRQLHARYLRGSRTLAALADRVRDRIAPCLDPSISS